MDKKYYERLRKLAESSPADDFKIGCFITDKKGTILSTGFNNPTKTHPIQAQLGKMAQEPQKKHLHAEMAALIKNKSNKAHSIFVSRLNAFGHFRLAKPCEICQLAIKKFSDIEEVYYTTNEGVLFKEKVKEMDINF